MGSRGVGAGVGVESKHHSSLRYVWIASFF